MKIFRILKSRLKKKKEEDWILERREACRVCPFNSKNMEKIPWNKKMLIKLSNFYSYITGNLDEDNLGSCTKCGCSVFYGSAEITEECPDNRWKK